VKKPFYRKILLIKTGAAGDIILTSPFFQSISASFPGSEIHLLTKEEYKEVVMPCPVFHRIHWFGKVNMRKTIAELNQENFDLVVNLQGNLRTDLLVFALRAKRKAGFSEHLIGNLIYDIQLARRFDKDLREPQIKLLQKLGADNIISGFKTWLDKDAVSSFPEFMEEHRLVTEKSWVVFHPVASPEWVSKCWPAEYFARVGQSLVKEGYLVVLVGGKEGVEAGKKIEAMIRGEVINLLGKTNFSQLVQVIEKARLVITTDSAPMHIAAATGTKTLALFGPTDPSRHCPPGVTFLSKPQKCSPCYKKICYRIDCLKDISPEEVKELSRRLIRESK